MRFEPFSFQRHAQWVKEHVNCVFCDDTKGIVAINDDGIAGAMIADSWTPNSVQVHVGLTDPLCLKHGLHIKFAEWIFNTCGITQMLGLVPSDNEKALKIDKHFGFKEIARIPDAYSDGVDYIVMRILKSECKYISQMREAA